MADNIFELDEEDHGMKDDHSLDYNEITNSNSTDTYNQTEWLVPDDNKGTGFVISEEWLVSPMILGLTGAAIFISVLVITVTAVILRINLRRRLTNSSRMTGEGKPAYTNFRQPNRAFSPRPSFSEDKPRSLLADENTGFSSRPTYQYQAGNVPLQPIYDIPEVSECRPPLREFKGRPHQPDVDSRSSRKFSGLHGDIGLPSYLNPRLYSFSSHPDEDLMPHSFATLNRGRLRNPSRPVSMYGSYLDGNGQIHVYSEGYSIPKARLSYARTPSRPPSYTPTDPYQDEINYGHFEEMQEEYRQENTGPEVRKVVHKGVNTGPCRNPGEEGVETPGQGQHVPQETPDRRWSSLKVTQEDQRALAFRTPRPRLNSVV